MTRSSDGSAQARPHGLHYDDISFTYRRGRPPVIEGLSWSPRPGRTVLLGPNGAGKSTLLALGARALLPTVGSVRVGDVGWMPQRVAAVAGLRVREQVAYAGWLHGMPRREALAGADVALDRVGLADRAGARVSELSGGQLRRVGLAEALVVDPDVLLLDEPTSGLDPQQRARFRSVLQGLPSGRSVVVSTHQVDDLGDLFEHVVVLLDGRIAFDGSLEEFLAPADGQSETRRAEEAYRLVLDTVPS